MRTCDVFAPAPTDPNSPRTTQKCPQMGCLGPGKKRDAALARLTAKLCEEIHHAYVINMIIVAKRQTPPKKGKKKGTEGTVFTRNGENNLYQPIIQDK